MKSFLSIALLLASVSSYAFEAKVICSIDNGHPAQDSVSVAVKLNKEIVKAIASGFDQVSAPSITQSQATMLYQACVTVSKK